MNEERQSRQRTVAVALVAGAAVVSLWVTLSFATTLIFHFHPALVGLTVGWVFRRCGRGSGLADSLLIIVLTAALVASGAAALAAVDRGLDASTVTGVVSAAGLLAGLLIARRARTHPLETEERA
jgi:hypothetical protein